jgi:lauroyl/myristoyl acyltransferase
VRTGGYFYVRLAKGTRQTIITNIAHVKGGLSEHGVNIASLDDFAVQNLKATVALLPETALCWQGPRDEWRGLIDTVHGEDALSALADAASGQRAATEAPPENPLLDDPPPEDPLLKEQSPKELPPKDRSLKSQPRGVLLLSPHLGNWELLNMYLGAEFGLTVLYDPPKIAALEPVIRLARQRTRSTVLPIGASGLREMVRRLKRGAVVGLLPDQVPSIEAGVLAPFYGKQALTINLVHRLASRHQPRVFLVCALRKPNGRFDIHFDELTDALVSDSGDISEESSATALNRAIERRVSQAPEQYQWSYKRFKRVDQTQPNIYRRASASDAKTRG